MSRPKPWRSGREVRHCFRMTAKDRRRFDRVVVTWQRRHDAGWDWTWWGCAGYAPTPVKPSAARPGRRTHRRRPR